jgi:hypothetical protein
MALGGGAYPGTAQLAQKRVALFKVEDDRPGPGPVPASTSRGQELRSSSVPSSSSSSQHHSQSAAPKRREMDSLLEELKAYSLLGGDVFFLQSFSSQGKRKHEIVSITFEKWTVSVKNANAMRNRLRGAL